MSSFNFKFAPLLKGKRTGVILNDDEIEILDELRINGNTIDLKGLEPGRIQEILRIFKKINGESQAIIESNGDYQLTDEGIVLFEEIKRITSVSKFYAVHPYIRPAVTVDGIIFYGEDIVLIERGNEPFKGKKALPGGYVSYNEKVENAFLREMKEEIGRDIKEMKLFTVVSDPGRDPRGHTVSIVFSGHIDQPPIAGDDAAKAFLLPLSESLKIEMAFDHQEIIRKFVSSKDNLK
ncbi:MAG: NUDIX domain-containing protein [Thermoplasmata archaeon]